MTALSIIVPCFNEQECLAVLHERLTTAARTAVGEDYEILLVNDGSRDRTWEMMRDLAPLLAEEGIDLAWSPSICPVTMATSSR